MRLLPDNRCNSVLGRELGHYLGGALCPFIYEHDDPALKRLCAEALRKEHDGFVAEREAGQCE